MTGSAVRRLTPMLVGAEDVALILPRAEACSLLMALIRDRDEHVKLFRRDPDCWQDQCILALMRGLGIPEAESLYAERKWVCLGCCRVNPIGFFICPCCGKSRGWEPA